MCPVISLAGEDNVDKWAVEAWDKVLGQVTCGVIVSTHQVLYDALAHGFVRLGCKRGDERKSIGLLIFDEGTSIHITLSTSRSCLNSTG